MSAPKYAPRYRVSDYRLWEGDWELWDGFAVAMTPSPFGSHQWLAGRILTDFNRPRWIVEVLSESTAEKDRTAKFQLFQDQSVRHYVIVDPSTGAIEVYCLPSGVYQPIVDRSVMLELDDRCKVVVSNEWLAGKKP